MLFNHKTTYEDDQLFEVLNASAVNFCVQLA